MVKDGRVKAALQTPPDWAGWKFAPTLCSNREPQRVRCNVRCEARILCPSRPHQKITLMSSVAGLSKHRVMRTDGRDNGLLCVCVRVSCSCRETCAHHRKPLTHRGHPHLTSSPPHFSPTMPHPPTHPPTHLSLSLSLQHKHTHNPTHTPST